jgi:hypothetical protein
MSQNVKNTVAAALMALSVSWQAACQASSPQPPEIGPIPVTVVERGGRYMLLRGGQPFTISGAGIDGGNIESFAAHGGTSFRNWDTRDGLRILDEAARHGVTVAMCIAIGRERLGFDYDDEEAVAQQLEFARNEVLKFKDHPALLIWIIGNEPDFAFTNPRVFDAINDISKMIHEVDGNHPTTTALTSDLDRELVTLLEERAPDLDIISLQKYAAIVNVPGYIEEAGINRPFLVTEWGPVGHWEVPKTSWGAPIERNSSEKSAHYLKSYEDSIAPHSGQIIGSYAFLWGQKQERTSTWFGMFLEDGTETEAIDVMHYIWNGSWPDNRSPRIETMLLDSKTSAQDVVLEAGAVYLANVVADDLDGDPLSYRWEVMRESDATQVGGDREKVPDVLSGLLDKAENGAANVRAPREAGAYRLFVYVYDGRGHAGHANIPFLVK